MTLAMSHGDPSVQVKQWLDIRFTLFEAILNICFGQEAMVGLGIATFDPAQRGGNEQGSVPNPVANGQRFGVAVIGCQTGWAQLVQDESRFLV